MILQKAVEHLKKGHVILYPTDTVWGIGGDATDSVVVNRIYSIKSRSNEKALICLASSLEMLRIYIPKIPKKAHEFISSETPTTLIYENPQGLAPNLVTSNRTVAIRIPKHDFCKSLIKAFGKPIVSTSANMSAFPTPKCFKAINPEILEAVDYAVPLEREKKTSRSSRILRINDSGIVEIIRP